jgi:hypothetical protein
MSEPWVPPRRAYHLRIFAVSLLIVVLALVGFLFGVRLEAIVPATGLVVARDQHDLRAPLAGAIELGWYDGEIVRSEAPSLAVRVDRHGNGVTDPTHGPSHVVVQHKLKENGQDYAVQKPRFHKLQAGDELWPGQPLARVQTEGLEQEARRLEARLEDLKRRGEPAGEVAVQLESVRERIDKATITVPDKMNHWLVLKVTPEPLQPVAVGESIALVTPLEPQTHRPKSMIALLDIHEKHTGDVQPGQLVRLDSTMYSQRLHGHAQGKIERIEPLGEAGPAGERRFRAVAEITHSPFVLRAGSSFRAEIVIGRKQVYRIILEQ